MPNSAGFSVGVDYFTAPAGLAVIASSDGRSAQTAQATGKCGDVVAIDVYGDQLSPSSEYRVTAAVASLPFIGSVHASGDHKIMVESVSVTTAAGAAPTVKIQGKEIEEGGTAGKTYALAVALSPRHCAQEGVVEAFELSGAGVDLSKVDYDFAATVGLATKAGLPIASDCHGGVVTVKATAIQSGAAAPTVTPKNGFVLTSPPASNSPDAGYVEWTWELQKALAATEPTNSVA